ncbi:hypothetical protein ABZ154_28615 [Streptomyces sp. NPDC006261]|uniref:hypothetical protein n=1 Tax=Streptomyces sp. NPDC006261 TaxID=3156739 RepID=UPI0033A78653
MSTTAPQPTPPADETSTGASTEAPAPDRTRFWSGLCAGLFAPAALVAGLLTLTGERAGRCMTYGQQCGDSLPGWLFGWSLALAVVACAVALAATTVRVRQVAFATQLLAEFVALTVVLSHT